MINGIEILTQSEVIAELAFNWWAFAIVFVIIMLCGAYIGTAVSPFISDRLAIFAVIAIFAGGFFSTVAGTGFATPTKYETHYKVTINDSVPINEFLNTYEIVDQEGKIYTIKEKKHC